MVKRLSIEEFLPLAATLPVLDVRSPGEYAHAHIPGAYSLPLFTDEERKVVGTTYKQQSREDAIKIGLNYYGDKMRPMVETVEQLIRERNKGSYDKPQGHEVLVHCWRGGMRSAAVAWLLDLYGFTVYTLAGGYKAFRTLVLETFANDVPLVVLGGYTGAGKTIVLHELAAKGQPVIDLEELAAHKGSAFGAIDREQPTGEMFENMLALELMRLTDQYPGQRIWLESESQRIGKLNIPHTFFTQMQDAPLMYLDIPAAKRLEYIVTEYGKLPREVLVNAIIRIQKRLGGLNAKTAINALLDNDVATAFDILLRYYDKYYGLGLEERRQRKIPITTVAAADVQGKANARAILAAYNNLIAIPDGTN